MDVGDMPGIWESRMQFRMLMGCSFVFGCGMVVAFLRLVWWLTSGL